MRQIIYTFLFLLCTTFSYGKYTCSACLYGYWCPIKEVELNPVIKDYLEAHIDDSEISSDVRAMDLEKLQELIFTDHDDDYCTKRSKSEIGLFLYKFYERGTCLKDRKIIRFLLLCFGIYIKFLERGKEPLGQHPYVDFVVEKKRLGEIWKSLRSN